MFAVHFQSGRAVARSVLLAVLLANLAPAVARAQSQASTGQIGGSIVDSAGAVVNSATVKASNVETGLERSVETSDDGLFTIVLLPPGTYTVTVQAAGFQNTTVGNVQVVVGRTNDVRLALGTGGVQEEVTVTAGAIEVQTTRSEPDALVNERAIDNLPINGRRFQDFVTLTPMAQIETQRQQISLAGQRGINSNINVDGVDYNNPFFGGIRGGERSNFAPTIPQESIREFQVVAAGYSAEFGRSTGGIVNAVTKSGTNEFHGTAFYLLRPKDFARGNPEIRTDDRGLQLAPTQQQWGASVGGPVIEDRAFFFAAYEQQRIRLPRVVIFDALASVIGTPENQAAISFYRANEGPFTGTNDAVLFNGRFDYAINELNSFSVRYNFSNNTGENASNTGNAILPTTNRALSNDGTERDRTHTVVGQVTSLFSSSLVNELRTQYSFERRPREANSTSPNLQTTLGNTGNRNFLPTTQEDWRFQIADSITWTKGNHTAKFGVEYNHVSANQTFGFNQFGTYAFFNATDVTLELLTPGGATENVLDNRGATYTQQIGNLLADYSTDELAFFAQDAWRIRPNFTLNFGLRWEGQYNPTPEANNTDLINQLNGVVFPIGRSVDPTDIPDSTDQWGPRLGFAWDPWNDSRTVIRAYGGIYYARTPLLLFSNAINSFRLPPGDVSVRLPFPVAMGEPDTLYDQFLLIGIDLNAVSLDGLPTLSPEQIQQIAQELGLSPDPFFGAGVLLIAPDFENPRSYQAGVGVEREIAEGLTVGADFTYVNTVHLQRNRNLNLPGPVVRADDPAQRPFYGLSSGGVRPVPTLGDVTVRESTAHSLYRALTFSSKFQRRWGQFNTFYTLSYNYSDDDNERSATGFNYENSFDLSQEYNYSDLDRRHQFVASPAFFLPYGFEISSAIRLRSGTPITAQVGFDANQDRNTFAGVDRPFSAPGVPFKRNSFRNRALYDVDLRVQKRFTFAETQDLILSAEIFNLFNYENITFNPSFGAVTNYCSSPVAADCGFGGPTNVNFLQIRDQNPDSPTFGRLLTGNNAGAPFQVQFGLRYQF
jgi:hypothetical protein